MKLEKWYIGPRSDGDPYQPPETQPALHGNVYGHPDYKDGTFITTSLLKRVKDGKVETQSGSLYELGEVATEYEAVYPNAKARVLAQEKFG